MKKVRFDTCGPFELHRSDRRSSRWRDDFWKIARENYEYVDELKSAIGCYVFFTRRNDLMKPWYAGKTLNEEGFKAEIFTDHKVHILHQIENINRSPLAVVLFPLLSENGEYFSADRSSSYSKISRVERTLIGMTIAANKKSLNIRDAKNHRELVVNGVIGSVPGRPPSQRQLVSRAFGRE